LTTKKLLFITLLASVAFVANKNNCAAYARLDKPKKEPRPINISLTALNDVIIKLTILESFTIADIKTTIYTQYGIPPEEQYILIKTTKEEHHGRTIERRDVYQVARNENTIEQIGPFQISSGHVNFILMSCNPDYQNIRPQRPRPQ